MEPSVTQIELTDSGRRVPDHSFHHLVIIVAPHDWISVFLSACLQYPILVRDNSSCIDDVVSMLFRAP